MLRRPFDGPHQGAATGGEPVTEHLHGEQFRLRRLLLDGGGYSCAVPQPVEVAGGFGSVRPDGHSTRDATHVRMQRVNAAVHHRDANALAPAPGQR